MHLALLWVYAPTTCIPITDEATHVGLTSEVHAPRGIVYLCAPGSLHTIGCEAAHVALPHVPHHRGVEDVHSSLCRRVGDDVGQVFVAGIHAVAVSRAGMMGGDVADVVPFGAYHPFVCPGADQAGVGGRGPRQLYAHPNGVGLGIRQVASWGCSAVHGLCVCVYVCVCV
jgi:hypothetical protein